MSVRRDERWIQMRSIVCMRSSRVRSAIAIRKHDRLGRNSDGKGMRERTEHEPSTAVYIRRRAPVSGRRRGDRRAHVGSWPASASACWCSCCQPRRTASVSLIPNVDRDRVARHVLPRVAEWRRGGSSGRSFSRAPSPRTKCNIVSGGHSAWYSQLSPSG